MQDMEHRKCTYSTLLKILKRNVPQVSALHKWENIKIALQEISSEVWTWNELTEDRVQQWVSANNVINNDVAQKILKDSVLRQYPICGVSGTNDTDILLYIGQDTHIQRVWYVQPLALCIMATKDKKQVLSHRMSHTSA